jgi:hypothetical protein
MSEQAVTEIVQMSIASASELATECWRLGKLNRGSFLYTNDRLTLERSVRRLTEMLGNMGLRSLDFAGSTYDPGMAPEVVEIQLDDTLSLDASVVEETIQPTVMWNGKVIQAGQIVVRQTAKKSENAEGIA